MYILFSYILPVTIVIELVVWRIGEMSAKTSTHRIENLYSRIYPHLEEYMRKTANSHWEHLLWHITSEKSIMSEIIDI